MVNSLNKVRTLLNSKSFILCLCIISLFILVEVILRVDFFWKDFPIYNYKVQEKNVHCYDDQIEAIRLCPNVNASIIHPLGFKFRLSTNQYSERISAFNSKLELYRDESIWAIGDSLTMGWGIDDESTFSYILSKNDSFIKNLASDSLGSIDIKNILQQKLKFNTNYSIKLPTKIIWMFSRSDFVDDMSRKPNSHIFFVGKYFRSLIALRSIFEAKKFVKDRNDYRGSNLEDFKEPSQTHPTLLALREISSLSKEYQIPIIIVLAPDWKYPNGPPNYDSIYLEYMDNLFRSMDFKVLNLREQYGKESNQDFYIKNDGHPSAFAHQIIARELHSYLRRMNRN